MESDERFVEERCYPNEDHETGKQNSQYQQDAENDRKQTEEERRLALLAKMRSTNGSNGFTEATSKTRRRRKMLRDPDGVFGADMGEMDRPMFQRQLNKDEIDRILQENPEIADEFDNERQRWLEFGEEDPNNINPLSDYNTLLVAKMQKGYDNKAEELIKGFREKDFKEKLEKIEKERQDELKELEMDRLEMQGQAVAFATSEGITVRKRIKRKKKGKKKGKKFVLDTPYGRATYFKRKHSPEAVESRSVMFQNRKNLSKKARAKAQKIHDEDSNIHRSGSSIVEGDEVMFETGFGPNKLIESDDEFDEGDMVFYNKDDMTQYSKNLGINKLQSRISLINFGLAQTKNSFGNFRDHEMDEDDDAQYINNPNLSPGPKRKLIQKARKKKKRKSNSISAGIGKFNKNKVLSVRDAISSIESDDSGGMYSSEEDNPNDRSGLLSNIGGGKRDINHTSTKKKKGRVTRKNKWLNDKEKDTESLGRKSFRTTMNLSLILPRYKHKMKRTKIIRKKQNLKQVHAASGSPYEEYLPARFKDIQQNELNSSRLSNPKYRKDRDIQQKELEAMYIYSPSIPLTSAKPPLSKQNNQKEINFYTNKSTARRHRGDTGQSATSLGTKAGMILDVGDDELEESKEFADEQDVQSSHFDDMNHDNVMFQRNHRVKPHEEDKAQKPTSALLFAMNKDFHKHDTKLISVDSRDGSRQGSRAGSKGRTYTTDKAVISSVLLK